MDPKQPVTPDPTQLQGSQPTSPQSAAVSPFTAPQAASMSQANPLAEASPAAAQQTPPVPVSPPFHGPTASQLGAAVPPPAAPISGPHKEFAPIPQPQRVEAPVEEYLQPSELEPVLHPELKEAGVEVPPPEHQPQIPDDLKQIMEHAQETLSVPTTASTRVTLPMTELEAMEAQKTAPISDSLKWFAAYVLRQLKKMQRQTID